MSLLNVTDIHKKFPIKGGNKVCAVNGVDLMIEEGKTLGLVGESGCGKSTIGRMIMRLTAMDSGEILFEGNSFADLEKSRKEVVRLRREIQMVFQDPYGSLNPRKKIRTIIMEPLLRNRTGETKEAMNERVVEMLKMVELDETYLEKYPIELTQGEQQRVGVARAFVTQPKLVILDEPTSLLDIRFRGEIVLLLKRLQKELGCAYLFISHDLNVIYQLSHSVAVMYLGRIVEIGEADRIFNDPQHPYTKALLNATLFPNPNQKHEGFLLKGEVPSPVNLPDDRCNFAARCPYAKDKCRQKLPLLTELEEGYRLACFLNDRVEPTGDSEPKPSEDGIQSEQEENDNGEVQQSDA